MRFSLPSVGASVRSKLGETIQLCKDFEDIAGLTNPLPPIPLTLDRQSLRVRYRCAIAQRLAAIVHQSPVELATQIATAWNQNDRVNGQALATIGVHRSGSLDLELTDAAIATWLDALSQMQISSRSRSPSQPDHPDGNQPFAVYYALDRSRSLIAAAEREGWFDRQTLAQYWLDDRGQLRLSLTAERHVILNLMQATDAIGDRLETSFTSSPKPSTKPSTPSKHRQDQQKIADRLAADFETLHRHSRPWHARHTHDTATASARLGLLLSYAHTLQAVLIPSSQLVGAAVPSRWLHQPDARTNSPGQNHS